MVKPTRCSMDCCLTARPSTPHSTARGWVAFTDRRVIIVTVQGITGKKKDYTTLPYSGIRAVSVDTTDGFETDANMELRVGDLGFSGLVGTATPCKIRLEFVPGIDVRDLERFVVDRIL